MKVILVPVIKKRVQSEIIVQRKKSRSEEKTKRKSDPQSRLSASETPGEEGYGHSWESDEWYSSFTDSSCSTLPTAGNTAWMAAIPLNLVNHPTHVVVDLGCTRSIGSRAALSRFQKHALHYGITTQLCPCNKSFVLANSEMETCW